MHHLCCIAILTLVAASNDAMFAHALLMIFNQTVADDSITSNKTKIFQPFRYLPSKRLIAPISLQVTTQGMPSIKMAWMCLQPDLMMSTLSSLETRMAHDSLKNCHHVCQTQTSRHVPEERWVEK
jgi:hypothetical protein